MSIKVGDVTRALTAPAGKLEQTVDRLWFGREETEVTGIVTAFMPTQYVIEQAAGLGANLLIAHEGPFFSHHQGTEPEGDPVYEQKRRLLEESGIALLRYHDALHRSTPDGVMEGLLHALGWMPYARKHEPAYSVVEFPSGQSLGSVAEQVKQRLGIEFLRMQGDPGTKVTRIGLLAGYRGGGPQAIPLFGQEALDLILYGEGPEWETPEYVRDALHQGRRRALIALGHAESEEPGMRLLADRLAARYPQVPVHYIKERPLFGIV